MTDIQSQIATTYRIEIKPDDSPESPREWDNIGHMVCAHGKYKLGDVQPGDQREILEYIARESQSAPPDDISDMDDDKLWHAIVSNNHILPLYLYDHSGITMKTKPFSCQWDSGQVGYIYISNKDAGTQYPGYDREKILGYLEGEVRTYDEYLRGDIYGYIVTAIHKTQVEGKEFEREEEIHSCWGHYGKEYTLDSAWENLPKGTPKEIVEVIQP